MGEFAAELALHFRPVMWSLAALGCLGLPGLGV